MRIAKKAVRILQKKALVPPITLERPEKEALEKGQYMDFKCKTNPSANDSATYNLPIPYFRAGKPEEWLRFRMNFDKVIAGQSITLAEHKFALARKLIEGDALAAFNEEAGRHRNMTNATLTTCLDAVTAHVFPAQALRTQTRYMRRFLRKPRDMDTRKWSARIQEINSYLPKFPTENGNAPAALSEDELLDIMEFGIPAHWQGAMTLQGFNPQSHSVIDFVQFCERLEITDPHAEEENSSNKGILKNSTSKSIISTSGKRKAGREGLNCLYHGPNCGHTTDNCYHLKQAAKKLKRENGGTNHTKKSYSRNEVNAMVKQGVKKFLDKNKKKKSGSFQEQELNNFEHLSVSDESDIGSIDLSSVNSESSA